MKNTSYFKIIGNRKKKLIALPMIRYRTKRRYFSQAAIKVVIVHLEGTNLKLDQIRNQFHFKENLISVMNKKIKMLLKHR
jgi:hypothetical protein